MARSIVCTGLLPTLGIFHRNRYNAFCLADDLMEPYRPYVDEIVHKMHTEFGSVSDMQKEHKAILLKIPATGLGTFLILSVLSNPISKLSKSLL